MQNFATLSFQRPADGVGLAVLIHRQQEFLLPQSLVHRPWSNSETFALLGSETLSLSKARLRFKEQVRAIDPADSMALALRLRIIDLLPSPGLGRRLWLFAIGAGDVRSSRSERCGNQTHEMSRGF